MSYKEKKVGFEASCFTWGVIPILVIRVVEWNS